MKLAVVVLISGSGSNLQALIDQSLHGAIDVEIKAVISNKSDAYGLERAKSAGIPAHALSHKDFDSRDSFDNALQSLIDQYNPELVVLAGFMRILTEDFTRHYEGRMLNIHPSLLPKFKGLDTHKRAIEANEKEHGVSVHFVSAELDAGAVILQAKTNIEANDTPETLANKVHALEHKIYPLSVHWFAQKRLTFDNGKAFLDNKALPTTGITYHTDLS
ncbi:phosphoribosylglycinamide formyltransferase [Marinomonas mediterranea]|jgi:formyltetrahydrofolate-dependent phosphoribosylglycinamide formyltransferase (EC 2.1.2.2)|uniref:Phosphoribosylglycinamide formyltransferase n=1 Tax=Marinomonas mediterranea (strain ATCC 700492 / JCM 21426 / NBRC 103028 / MMB-1) TaxID=717774 RepID=F2JY35_MARM1|nr:phosphoribosylglycinamide formyltransferase [Marinomonas mediterranea]ADZ90771.1 phosphoribosylglycinamide formyltransferase [Marinomonas mediterranea MMB-1]WCN08812.1 phosphoribosylglycinamide formyltransferase [Marinomonas mediterranea]WCN12857.1 phosphoribosylglycinamide formyltransferase [Marinomonas mediterranea]WCN16925.1 phosphoribosylglycinamide formyltransferase [Marinomonas mediterranea MMB-1]